MLSLLDQSSLNCDKDDTTGSYSLPMISHEATLYESKIGRQEPGDLKYTTSLACR
jgi:hypothetical protein